jgi:hypothetical protein
MHLMTFPRLTASLTLLTLIAATNLEAETIYVNELGANPSAPYGSWETATDSLQDALALAVSGDEIWVAKGTYFPDEGVNKTPDHPTGNFLLNDGVAIYGGFISGDTLLSEANPSAKENNCISYQQLSRRFPAHIYAIVPNFDGACPFPQRISRKP